MYDVWIDVIQCILLNYTQLCSEFKKINASLNINTQIKIDVRSLVRGTVVKCWSQLEANHPAVDRQFETHEERK